MAALEFDHRAASVALAEVAAAAAVGIEAELLVDRARVGSLLLWCVSFKIGVRQKAANEAAWRQKNLPLFGCHGADPGRGPTKIRARQTCNCSPERGVRI